MTNDSKDQGREAFEEWASEEEIDNFHFNHCWAAWQDALATSASALARDDASVESHVVFITDRSKSIDEVLPQDRRWVISHAIGLAAAYRNCDAGKTEEVMQEFVDYLRAAIDDAATSSAATVSDAASVLTDDQIIEIASRYAHSDGWLNGDGALNFARALLATSQAATTAGAQDEQACKCRRLGDWKGAHHPLCDRAASSATAPLTSDSDACELCNGVGKIGTPGQRCFACDGSAKSFAARAQSTNGEQS